MPTVVCQGIIEENRANIVTLFNSVAPEPMGSPAHWYREYISPDPTELSYRVQCHRRSSNSNTAPRCGGISNDLGRRGLKGPVFEGGPLDFSVWKRVISALELTTLPRGVTYQAWGKLSVSMYGNHPAAIKTTRGFIPGVMASAGIGSMPPGASWGQPIVGFGTDHSDDERWIHKTDENTETYRHDELFVHPSEHGLFISVGGYSGNLFHFLKLEYKVTHQ